MDGLRDPEEERRGRGRDGTGGRERRRMGHRYLYV